MSQEGLQLLSRVKAFSPYLTQVMRRHPALVQDLFDQDGYREKRSPAQLAQKLKERLAGVRDFQVFCLLLRHFKQEEILRIAIRDLGGLAGLKETTAELSALAQVCLATFGFLLFPGPGRPQIRPPVFPKHRRRAGHSGAGKVRRRRAELQFRY